MVPVFIWLFFKENYFYALIILSVAGATDFMDGFLARKFNMRSRLGSMLDPLADKFLMFLSFLALSFEGHLSWALTGIVIGRDFLILLGAFILGNILRIKLYFRPTRLSKTTTISQILVLILTFFLVFADKHQVSIPQNIIHSLRVIFPYVQYLVGLFTLVTSAQYGWIGYKFLKYGERK